MMHERGRSDAAIVAVKPANKAERSAAEPVEPRAAIEGNAGHPSTFPGTEPGRRVTAAGAHTASRKGQGLDPPSASPSEPEIGAVCGKAARTDLCGGRSVMSVPTATGALARRAMRGRPRVAVRLSLDCACAARPAPSGLPPFTRPRDRRATHRIMAAAGTPAWRPCPRSNDGSAPAE